jgi:hypothetical protein
MGMLKDVLISLAALIVFSVVFYMLARNKIDK